VRGAQVVDRGMRLRREVFDPGHLLRVRVGQRCGGGPPACLAAAPTNVATALDRHGRTIREQESLFKRPGSAKPFPPAEPPAGGLKLRHYLGRLPTLVLPKTVLAFADMPEFSSLSICVDPPVVTSRENERDHRVRWSLTCGSSPRRRSAGAFEAKDVLPSSFRVAPTHFSGVLCQPSTSQRTFQADRGHGSALF
jgi:hypothetical protein